MILPKRETGMPIRFLRSAAESGNIVYSFDLNA
jgi:hypothetical protein